MKEAELKEYKSTIKSYDTEEFIDLLIYRPYGYRCALFFRKCGIHPNAITIISIFLGIIAGFCFISTSLRWNILGIFFLLWANLYDSTDGQLARLTGKKTRWGRILDGFAGDVWFFFIYLAIAIRETFRPIPFMEEYEWGVIIWILCSFAGFWVHGSQSQLADYYRNIHLYFIKGENGNEYDNSETQRIKYQNTPWKGNFFWKIFLYAYIGYTANQERMSPMFQKFIKKIKEKYNNNIPTELRNKFRQGSLPLMKYTNILTFNSRAIFLWFTILIGHLWLYLFFEFIILGGVYLYMRHSHEKLCKNLITEI